MGMGINTSINIWPNKLNVIKSNMIHNSHKAQPHPYLSMHVYMYITLRHINIPL